MNGPSKRGPTLGPLGDKILFENEYVRIWSVKLDPGERQAGTSTICPMSSCR